eukprot:5336794-Pyramimonas_sp.AAC.1
MIIFGWTTVRQGSWSLRHSNASQSRKASMRGWTSRAPPSVTPPRPFTRSQKSIGRRPDSKGLSSQKYRMLHQSSLWCQGQPLVSAA